MRGRQHRGPPLRAPSEKRGLTDELRPPAELTTRHRILHSPAMRLLHSADWQIGARFRQFGAQAARLREARVRTLRRVLELAAERQADALLIAGDLFEDHQIEPAAVAEVFELLATHRAVPIYILPGNHDPIGSPGAIWARRPFVSPPAHAKIFGSAEAVPLAGGFLIANPLTQKQSAIDPSLRLAEL